KPGQTEQSIGGLDSTTLVFPKDLIKAFFSSSSDLSVGQSLQAPSKTGLDFISSSSHTTVANLDCNEARSDLKIGHSSHSSHGAEALASTGRQAKADEAGGFLVPLLLLLVIIVGGR